MKNFRPQFGLIRKINTVTTVVAGHCEQQCVQHAMLKIDDNFFLKLLTIFVHSVEVPRTNRNTSHRLDIAEAYTPCEL